MRDGLLVPRFMAIGWRRLRRSSRFAVDRLGQNSGCGGAIAATSESSKPPRAPSVRHVFERIFKLDFPGDGYAALVRSENRISFQ